MRGPLPNGKNSPLSRSWDSAFDSKRSGLNESGSG